MAAIAAANQARAAVLAAPAIEAQKKALEAVAAARAAEEKAKADSAAAAVVAQLQAATQKAVELAKWKEQEETIEEALEHAGISGVDVQIDATGFAKVVGTVTSQLDRDTALAMVEQFKVTGVDSKLEIVAPPPEEKHEDPFKGNASQPVKYKVKAGESWWGIAHRVYGDGQLWKALKAANNNPKMIHPGTEIVLPPKDKLPK
ncbi:MAG: LysM peptidoglycan-binding domain-containing protein [Myxococcota bacterium]